MSDARSTTFLRAGDRAAARPGVIDQPGLGKPVPHVGPVSPSHPSEVPVSEGEGTPGSADTRTIAARPDPHHEKGLRAGGDIVRARLRVRLLTCSLLVGVATAAGCAAPPETMVDAKSDATVTSAAAPTPVWSLHYSGAEEAAIVPEGVTGVQVQLAGGAGGGHELGGRGSVLTAKVPVDLGDTVGVSVGGQDNTDGKSPGGGGWGITAGGVNLSGGPGGHGVSIGQDGSGGWSLGRPRQPLRW